MLQFLSAELSCVLSVAAGPTCVNVALDCSFSVVLVSRCYLCTVFGVAVLLFLWDADVLESGLFLLIFPLLLLLFR